MSVLLVTDSLQSYSIPLPTVHRGGLQLFNTSTKEGQDWGKEDCGKEDGKEDHWQEKANFVH